MSGSEIGSREQFPIGFHKPQPQPQQLPNVRLDYAPDGSAVYKTAQTFHPSPTVVAHVNGGETAGAAVPQGDMGLAQAQVGGSSNEPLKRKRGRPRKYGIDGGMSLGLTSNSPAAPPVPVPAPAPTHLQFSPGFVTQPGGQFSPAPPPASASPGSSKKGRGRPRGSLNKTYKKRRDSHSGSGGSSFTPHVITVKAGEDLSSRILALSQNGPRIVCILSANGAISNVTLHQPATTGGMVTYEGRFEILSLTGSFFPNENGNQPSRLGGLSVSLSGPDGRVLGGGVAGQLIAAAPVQLVLGSFLLDGRKEAKSANKMENVSALTPTAGQSSSPSGGTLSESSDGSESPPDQSAGACNNNNPPPGMSGIPWK